MKKINVNYEWLITWLAIGVPVSLVVIFCSADWPVLVTGACVILIEVMTVIAGALCVMAGRTHDLFNDLEARR